MDQAPAPHAASGRARDEWQPQVGKTLPSQAQRKDLVHVSSLHHNVKGTQQPCT